MLLNKISTTISANNYINTFAVFPKAFTIKLTLSLSEDNADGPSKYLINLKHESSSSHVDFLTIYTYKGNVKVGLKTDSQPVTFAHDFLIKGFNVNELYIIEIRQRKVEYSFMFEMLLNNEIEHSKEYSNAIEFNDMQLFVAGNLGND